MYNLIVNYVFVLELFIHRLESSQVNFNNLIFYFEFIYL